MRVRRWITTTVATVLAAGTTPGPAGYAGTLAVAVACALLGALLAGRVVPGRERPA